MGTERKSISLDPFVDLATRAIRTYVMSGERLEAPAPSERMEKRAGVFVSIKSAGRLRGCIGTFSPTKPSMAEEIVDNAIASASRDPRFPPIRPKELPALSISVDVLSPPERCEEGDLDPHRFGVIVESGWRRGLLLPDLEGVDDVRSQLSIARQKAGIAAGDSCTIYRFTVERHQ